jgi:hypothetical protein
MDVKELLEIAASFARAGDITAAVERARAALRAATDANGRDAARLAVEKLTAEEESWRKEIRARLASHLARERTAEPQASTAVATPRPSPSPHGRRIS